MSRWTSLIYIIFISILAWFTYRTIDGILAILLFGILLELISVISIIPIIGWIISLVFGWYYVLPWVLDFTGIHYTWVITLLFWVFGINGFIITIMVLVVILGAMIK